MIGSGSIRDELAQETLKLCSIPSETGNEREIADYVEAFCREQAPDATIHRIGESVVCIPRAEPLADRPWIALVGHLDTVKCAEEQPTEIRDGRVYGCGSSDMKAGVATMMSLLRQWKELDRINGVWLFYDKEEGPHAENGLGPVLESGVIPPLDLAVVLEPTDRTLQLGCMGTMHATVTVHGKRAHSARPWHGENALYRAIPLIERFADLERREVTFGPLTFYEVIGVTRVWTENSANVVPDRVMLNVNVRFAPGRTGEDATRELREIVGDDAEISVRDIAPAGTVYLDDPLIEPWRRRSGLEVEPKQAWTDVARFTERDIPALNFGPGETAQAHQAGEWCSIDSLEFVYGHLHDFLANPAPEAG